MTAFGNHLVGMLGININYTVPGQTLNGELTLIISKQSLTSYAITTYSHESCFLKI